MPDNPSSTQRAESAEKLTPIPASSSPMLYTESRTVEPGNTVQVPIMMKNANSITSLNTAITYDSSIIKVVDMYKGSLLSNIMVAPNYSESGVIKLGFAVGDASISSDGSVAYILFEAIGNEGDTSPVKVSQGNAIGKSGQSISLQVSSGMVTLESQTLMGDYNGDNRVTELDALAALRMSVDLLNEELILDMDKDGEVTAQDAHLILLQAVGK